MSETAIENVCIKQNDILRVAASYTVNYSIIMGMGRHYILLLQTNPFVDIWCGGFIVQSH